MISIEEAKKAFEYDPESGALRRVSTGKIVGYEKKTGYLWLSYKSKKYRVHRIVWMVAMGEVADRIDHINGDRSDNRLANLRSVGCLENSQNTKLRHDNKSGCAGVSWNLRAKKWMAQIKSNGQYFHLGNFSDLNMAIIARKRAEVDHGFHPNHGEQRKRYERD